MRTRNATAAASRYGGREGSANRLCHALAALEVRDGTGEQIYARKCLSCHGKNGEGSKEHPEYKTRLGRWARRLLNDKVQLLIAQTRRECAGQAQAQAVEKELSYFVNNVDRMQYGTFRTKGFFIGSGVIEAGCKTVIGSRLKRSGMFWTVRGANAILALRCCHLNGRFEDYWEARRAA